MPLKNWRNETCAWKQARPIRNSLDVDEALPMIGKTLGHYRVGEQLGRGGMDLKPANVMITDGDKVKILDFGLAKALSDETQSIDSSQSPTLTEAMTRPGVLGQFDLLAHFGTRVRWILKPSRNTSRVA